MHAMRLLTNELSTWDPMGVSTGWVDAVSPNVSQPV